MNFHSEKLEKVLDELKTSGKNGLTEAEVKARLEKYGENRLSEKKKKTLFARFLEQFKDVMIIILIIAAFMSFGISIYEGEGFFEPILILLIVIINAVIGVMQENKAEKALEALKNLSSPHARVIRDGKEEVIEASQLVPGDIIKIEAGDFIPADARLIHSASLKCEESALTGESVPSEKYADDLVDENAPLGDRHNMVFTGCSVSYGTGIAVVCGTGMNTEMGKIAGLLEGVEGGQTPLQHKLAQLGKYLGFIALGCCAIIMAVGLLNGNDLIETFMIAISLAVSAIPEGLPAIVTVILAIGVQQLVKKNAIIRSLPAVETLGSASVICSDKTGTLTQNRMTVVKAYVDGDSSDSEVNGNECEAIRKLLTYGTLCCDGSVTVDNDGNVKHIGDPTETAIVYAAKINGMEKDSLNNEFNRLAEIPFDSDRKLMTTVNKINGKYTVIVKGAFDVMASRCVNGNMEKAKNVTEEMSRQALRVIAVGYKELDEMPKEITSESLENGLTFMGLVGMIDPPRPEAKEAVKLCLQAGITPVMITGDHVVTASAIAEMLGIKTAEKEAITGVELDDMTDEELDNRVENIAVYARVSPENKIRIVKAWQRKGHVVSMTGDGVNDAPALKAADIGCAMGITGTDVAKGAADMTLADDNFATIVDAVKQGRGIYANIKKVVSYLLGTNIGEIVTVFCAMMLWKSSPLMAVQLLWINLVTDSFPAIALGMEPIEADIMDEKPRPKHEGIFAHGLGVKVVLQGFMFGILTLFAFWCGTGFAGFEAMKAIIAENGSTLHSAETMAFIVLAFSQVVQAFNVRSSRSIFKIGPFTNKTLNIAALASLALTLGVLFIPGINTIFGLTYLSAKEYAVSFGLVFVPLVVIELIKLVNHIRNKNK